MSIYLYSRVLRGVNPPSTKILKTIGGLTSPCSPKTRTKMTTTTVQGVNPPRALVTFCQYMEKCLLYANMNKKLGAEPPQDAMIPHIIVYYDIS